NGADLAHALLAFLLFFQKFSFAGYIPSVTFGDHVLADGADRFARHYLLAYGCLYGYFEHVAGNQFFQLFAQLPTPVIRLLAMDDCAERVDPFPIEHHIEFDHIRFMIPCEVIIQRCVTARNRFEFVEEIEYNFGKRHFERQFNPVRRKVRLVLDHPAFVHAQTDDGADVLRLADDLRIDKGFFNAIGLGHIRHFRRGIDIDDLPIRKIGFELHGRHRGDHRHAEFTFQSFLDDLHVKHAEKTAPESKSQGS